MLYFYRSIVCKVCDGVPVGTGLGHKSSVYLFVVHWVETIGGIFYKVVSVSLLYESNSLILNLRVRYPTLLGSGYFRGLGGSGKNKMVYRLGGSDYRRKVGPY